MHESIVGRPVHHLLEILGKYLRRSRYLDLAGTMSQLQSQTGNSSQRFYSRDIGASPYGAPIAMLDAVAPSHGVVANALDYFHNLAIFKATVTFGTLIVAIMSSVTSLSFVWHRIMNLAGLYLQSTVTIEADDTIHTHVMTWLAGHIITNNLQAKTPRASQHDCEEQKKIMEYVRSYKGEKFHLIEWQKFLQPSYEPYRGDHTFEFNGKKFWINRSREDTSSTDLATRQINPEPIKEFLQEAKRIYLDRECSKTMIFRPKDSHWTPRWVCVSTRPSRPMSTIILDESQKGDLLADINQFLHPTSPRWYANRGIPYRRGYLLHGPPGTGKSSLTFALGGNFGLPIYCLSLVDPSLTEERLMAYFGELPHRCIMLLEDIDTVEMSQKRQAEEDDSSNKRDSRPKTAIPLTALLNAIDGVASHEGRILIMTTNHPEKLDPALKRSGRVDVTVEFKLASKQQTFNLFMNMYANKYDIEGSKTTVTEEDLIAAAEAFSEKLPDCRFSPAEIQGFLMVRRDDYKRALRDVEKWKDSVFAKRKLEGRH
ncbi:Paraplegin [Drechslerella dactyloides]|uniref:Paraplegin n=1 Tax=Drechslerella dactyloides TaxID=74499 RepID=A0AAD6J0H8_DREDA|nr:Paraplegin [Drechslerella dactyloides]